MALAKQIFDPLGVPVVTSHWVLGGFLAMYKLDIVLSMGRLISGSLIYLICQRWQLLSLKQLILFLLSLYNVNGLFIACCSDLFLFAPLKNAVLSSFLPAMFGCETSPLGFELFFLPVCFGCLRIPLPKHLAGPMYDASSCIVDSI